MLFGRWEEMEGHKELKTNIQAQFGKNAKNYVTSKIHAKGKDLTKLIEISDIKGDESVLDIATGGGHVANALAPLVKKVVALDLTTEILTVSKEFIEVNGHENVTFMEGDAEQLPFSDESFDVITCRIAAHHFPDISSFVRETFRTLKKEGRFLFIDNVAPESDDFDTFYNHVEMKRDYSHHRAWKKSEWVHLIERNEFEIEEMYRFDKTFIFEDWCKTMNLPLEETNQLSDYMLQTTKELKSKFRMIEKDQRLLSFMGESVLLKARKRS